MAEASPSTSTSWTYCNPARLAMDHEVIAFFGVLRDCLLQPVAILDESHRTLDAA
jgi:hypothetical protein